MKSYFKPCDLCGKVRPLNELEHDGRGFLTCSDPTECMKRVANQDQALLISKAEELEATNKKRGQLITEIEELRVKLGLPDMALIEHRVEMARIESE